MKERDIQVLVVKTSKIWKSEKSFTVMSELQFIIVRILLDFDVDVAAYRLGPSHISIRKLDLS